MLSVGRTRSKLVKYISTTQAGTSAPAVYFGGSITWGASATLPDTGSWRALLSAWLRATYGNNYHINSGVSGTPSWYGLVRMQADVIAHNPLLVTIDFAVNDWYDEVYRPSAEALIRRLRTSLPNATLLFIFNLYADVGANDPTNIFQPQADWYHTLCRYYDIPFVSFAQACKREVAAGNLLSAYINVTDDIHPTDAGHELIYRMLRANLAPLATPDTTAQWTEDLADYPPIHARALDFMETPTNVAASTATRTGTWTVDGDRITSSEADATAEWTATCSSFGFDARLGSAYPPGGVLQWQVDGGAWYTSDWTAAPTYVNRWPLWYMTRASHAIKIKVVSGTVSLDNFLAV